MRHCNISISSNLSAYNSKTSFPSRTLSIGSRSDAQRRSFDVKMPSTSSGVGLRQSSTKLSLDECAGSECSYTDKAIDNFAKIQSRGCVLMEKNPSINLTPEITDNITGNTLFSALLSLNKLSESCDEETAESRCLKQNGYTLGTKLCETLQGELFKARSISESSNVVIKKVDKSLHKQRISVQHGMNIIVEESMYSFSVYFPPPFITIQSL